MTIKIFNKLHFLTKTQFDALTTKSSNDLYFTENTVGQEIDTTDISSDIPAVVVLASYSSSSWYRKYSDGWIEQGGLIFISNYDSNSLFPVTFPIALISKPIRINCTPYNQPTNDSSTYRYIAMSECVTEKSFQINYQASNTTTKYTGYISWYVSGYYR